MKLKIKPEVNSLKYYIHIVIIALIVIFTLPWITNLFDCCRGTFIDELLALSIAIILGDIISHTLLNLD